MFKLKKGQEAFTPVEGPFAGRKFVVGQIYGEIPPGTAGKFEEIKKAAAAKTTGADLKLVPKTTAKDDSKKAAALAPSEKGGGKS
jgi:hypothetical protein